MYALLNVVLTVLLLLAALTIWAISDLGKGNSFYPSKIKPDTFKHIVPVELPPAFEDAEQFKIIPS